MSDSPNHRFYALHTSLLLVLLLQFCACGKTNLTVRDRERDGFKGPVQVVKWERQWKNFKDEHPSEWDNRQLWKTVTYDKIGNLVIEEYDTNYQAHIHDRYGRCIQTIFFNWNHCCEKKFYKTYDRAGNCMEERYVNADGQLIQKWTYQRIQEKNMDTVAVFDADGVMTGQSEWYYDDRGLVIRKTTLNPSDLECLFSYDESGRLVRKEQLSRDPQSDEEEETHVVILYEDGRETRWESQRKDGKLIHYRTYDYQFDEHGNWIVQTTVTHTAGDEPLEMERMDRTILYHY
ncbi:MAG: hypothetical protein C4527_15860 [Candidatus Omnitrophota bacterium]|jgi:hypothetical protein|nr:MAG: hypothetical protein C4527_15860 [Candidatus Omnitrophota bacterium]